MSLPPAPTLTDFDVVFPIMAGIGLLMSAFRLYRHIRERRFAWDDFFCAASAVSIIAMITAVYILEQPPSNIDVNTWWMSYYAAVVAFNSVVWLARISLIFTSVRIAAFRQQKALFTAIAVAFGIIYLVLVAQIFWICEPQPGWKTANPPQCDLGFQRSLTEILTDVFADVFLLAVPFYLLSRTSLDLSIRIRLILLFSTCVLLTVVSVVQDVLLLVAGGTREVFASMFEDAFALIVCNVPVVGAAMFRQIQTKSSSFESSYTEPRSGVPSSARTAKIRVTNETRVDLPYETDTTSISAYEMESRDARKAHDPEASYITLTSDLGQKSMTSV